MPRRVALVTACAGLVAAGCGQGPPPVQPPEPPVVTVANPVERELDTFTEFTGRLQAVEAVDVRAQVTGYLKTVYFETPTGGVLNRGLVKEGDKLYEIDPEPYDAALNNAEASLVKADADVITAESNLRRATADLARAEKTRTALSPEDFDRYKNTADTAAATVNSARAAVDAAKANLQKARFDRKNCTIRCEVKGVARVSRTQVTPGNLVRTGDTILCRVTSVDPIHAYFDVDEMTSLAYRRLVSEKELPDPRDPKTRLKCAVGLKDEAGYPHKGEVDYIDPEILRGTGTRTVRGLLPNPGYRLTPGDSVRVRVEAGKPRKYVTIPETAVGSQQRQKYVYVVNDKDEAEFRPVVLGLVREDQGVRLQVVESGVTPRDRVIVNGMLRVRPGVKVNPKPAAPAVPSAAVAAAPGKP